MAEYAWIITGDGRQVYRRVDNSPPAARSGLPFPMVISDEMDAVQSQLDGHYYTSKSRLRETYRAAGVTEVGNDPARNKPFVKPKPDRKAIRDTTEKAIARPLQTRRTQSKRA
jgi:hypothetical protein